MEYSKISTFALHCYHGSNNRCYYKQWTGLYFKNGHGSKDTHKSLQAKEPIASVLSCRNWKTVKLLVKAHGIHSGTYTHQFCHLLVILLFLPSWQCLTLLSSSTSTRKLLVAAICGPGRNLTFPWRACLTLLKARSIDASTQMPFFMK